MRHDYEDEIYTDRISQILQQLGQVGLNLEEIDLSVGIRILEQ
ncbi:MULTISPECIES: hypothetical protein [unclassified Sphingobacterium]|nr:MULTISPECIES: hypothetical protein [unclassified Sphingobacterium]